MEDRHRQERSDPAPGALPPVERPFEQFAKLIERLRALYQSPAWGHSKGLVAMLSRAGALPVHAPGPCAELRVVVEGMTQLFERTASAGLLKPAHVVALLRATALSDSCAVSYAALRKIDPPKIAKEREARWERATYRVALGVRDAVTRILEQKDADELADSWKVLVSRLEPGEGEDLTIDSLSMSTTADFMPLILSAARQPNSPQAKIATMWAQERAEQKAIIERILKLLAE